MKTNSLFILLVSSMIFLSCKKDPPVPESKEYKCSCNYTAYTLDHSGTYSSVDTFTVTATSAEQAKKNCEAEEDLYVWEIINVGCTASP